MDKLTPKLAIIAMFVLGGCGTRSASVSCPSMADRDLAAYYVAGEMVGLCKTIGMFDERDQKALRNLCADEKIKEIDNAR
jgi:hypothetical protein